jgi:hypothetical protein
VAFGDLSQALAMLAVLLDGGVVQLQQMASDVLALGAQRNASLSHLLLDGLKPALAGLLIGPPQE